MNNISKPNKNELVVGMQFKSDLGTCVTITEINFERDRILFETHEKSRADSLDGFHLVISKPNWEYIGMWGQTIETPNERPCAHLNVRIERYFSANEYHTCKDCDKKLN